MEKLSSPSLLDLEVLIVDEDDIICFLQERIVKNSVACPVSTFLNGEEALKYLERHQGRKNFLILLDVYMPEMNGWEFLEKCREKLTIDVSTVMVSASINKEDKLKAKTYSNVISYIEKPLTVQHFLKVVAEDILRLN